MQIADGMLCTAIRFIQRQQILRYSALLIDASPIQNCRSAFDS